MPITLITGAPGNGKSLLLLWEVEKRRQKENRPVFYSGINGLLLPWEQFGEEVDGQPVHMTDASKWYDLPSGSIIVIDEAQRLFRARSAGSMVPRYVQELETHRHKGFDIYLVSQGPGLLDSNVRNLVETHKHLMRKFGSTWATIHEFKGVRNNVIVSRKDSQETQWTYPKEVFGWYKSAEVHTVKRQIPKKVLLLLALPFVLAAAVGFAWFSSRRVAGPTPASAVPAGTVAPAVNGGGVFSPGQPRIQKMTSAEYLGQFEPRFAGLAYSAPRYDDLTRPVRVPVPVGCVLSGDKDGWCITQQGTKFYPPVAFVRDFIRSGMFVDFAVAESSPASQGQSPASTDKQGAYASQNRP